jgi:hypothetical protein
MLCSAWANKYIKIENVSHNEALFSVLANLFHIELAKFVSQ